MRTVFNVVMDSQGGVVGVFYGDMLGAFKAAVELAKEIYGVAYHETPDIVLANSYPCDLDFWQSHKSQYPAQRMVRPGGTIIICTPAPEGISPVHTELLDLTAWSSQEIKAAHREGRLKNGVAAALATRLGYGERKSFGDHVLSRHPARRQGSSGAHSCRRGQRGLCFAFFFN